METFIVGDSYILLPRLTTTEKNAITPRAGMLLFDITIGRAEIYTGSWGPLSSATSVSLGYSDLDTLITNSQVVPGLSYALNNRGDIGITVRGLSTKSVTKEGIRQMLCPKTYKAETLDGNVWKGVWFDDKTADVDDLFIRGGKVWRNLTGVIGTAPDEYSLDAVNYVEVPKASFANHEYIEMQFNVLYDFANDWIESQWDSSNVKVGVSTEGRDLVEEQFAITMVNPVDASDWNMKSNSFIVSDISCPYGFINNEITYDFVSVSATGIQNNRVEVIRNVTALLGSYEDFVFHTISGNRCQGIQNIISTQSIKNIPGTIDYYADHTDDESFYFEVVFSVGSPLNVGAPQFFNCLVPQGVVLIEIAAKGINLTDTDGSALVDTANARLAVGIEVDNELYLPTTTFVNTLNNTGTHKISPPSNPTTAQFRRFRVEAFGVNIVGGKLKVSGKYL